MRQLPIVLAYFALLTLGVVLAGTLDTLGQVVGAASHDLLAPEFGGDFRSAGAAAFPIAALVILAASSILPGGRTPRALARFGLLALLLGVGGAAVALGGVGLVPDSLFSLSGSLLSAADTGIAMFRIGGAMGLGFAAAALVLGAVLRPRPAPASRLSSLDTIGTLVALAMLFLFPAAIVTGGADTLILCVGFPVAGGLFARSWMRERKGEVGRRTAPRWLQILLASVVLIVAAIALAESTDPSRPSSDLWSEMRRLDWSRLYLLGFGAWADLAMVWTFVVAVDRRAALHQARHLGTLPVVAAWMAVVVLAANLVAVCTDLATHGHPSREYIFATRLTALIAAVFLLSAWQLGARPPPTTEAAEGGEA